MLVAAVVVVVVVVVQGIKHFGTVKWPTQLKKTVTVTHQCRSRPHGRPQACWRCWPPEPCAS
jgi:hypothetical protein